MLYAMLWPVLNGISIPRAFIKYYYATYDISVFLVKS